MNNANNEVQGIHVLATRVNFVISLSLLLDKMNKASSAAAKIHNLATRIAVATSLSFPFD